MQLHDPDLAPISPGGGEGLVGGGLGHAVADDLHGALALEGGGGVGDHALGDDLDGLILKVVRVDEGFGGDDATGG